MASVPENKPNPKMPPLEAPEGLEVEYVNLVRIAHSPAEIVFDLAQLLPGSGKATIQSRVVMSPVGAKLLYRALTDNLSKYEASFGEIRVPGGISLADSLFRPPEKPGIE